MPGFTRFPAIHPARMSSSRTLRNGSPRLCRGWHVLVMVVLLVGALVSSFGHMNSHGLAAVAGTHLDDTHAGHGHSHDDDAPHEAAAANEAGHPHHNSADHSHDPGHAVPMSLAAAPPAAPMQRPLAHPLTPGGPVLPLDRPPMS